MANPQTTLATKYGTFMIQSWGDTDSHGLLIWTEGVEKVANPLVRLHSSCIFSESLGSVDCDCNLQLQESLKLMSEQGGALVYLYQEGRGHGIERKIEAMEAQRIHNIDTHDAFELLGLDLDPRDYSRAISALKELHLASPVRLISNNPRKLKQLTDAGFGVGERIQLNLEISPEIEKYLLSKKNKLGHDINVTNFSTNR